MEKINIICVDDQPEVLDSVLRDLRPLNSCFRLEGVESASECRELFGRIRPGRRTDGTGYLPTTSCREVQE